MTAGDQADPASCRDMPKVIELVVLDLAVLHALAAGDLAAANGAATVTLTSDFVAPEVRGLWRRRSIQVESDPGAGGWVTGAIYDPRRDLAVGHAGYHGPPDATGLVEVGYTVHPAYRRQGYARAALEALLDRASREPSVRKVRASIGPPNLPSRRLVLQYGFVAVGEQWDDEDGLETIFEVVAD